MPEYKIEPLKSQYEFMASSYKYPAIIGGLGSGKSYAGIYRLIWLMLDNRKLNTAYYMPVYSLLKQRAIPGFEEELSRLDIEYKTNISDMVIKIKDHGSIFFRSYDNPERIIAYEVGDSIVDEIDTLKKDKASIVWRKVSERNRQNIGRPNTIGCVTTPDQGKNGFVYARWGNNDNPDYHLIKASTRDNTYLPEDYVSQIVENYDPILADLYLDGEFVSLTQNKVYHFFNPDIHHSDREIRVNDRLHIGVDFNIGGCCCTVFVMDASNPIAVDEFVAHDTYDIINILGTYKNQLVVYPDASGRASRTNASGSDIDLLEQAGFFVDAPKKNPLIRDRINSVNALLSKQKLLINTKRCHNLTDALLNQGYTDKGEPEKYDEHPAIDDWCDSMGYFIHRMNPINKPMLMTNIGYAI